MRTVSAVEAPKTGRGIFRGGSGSPLLLIHAGFSSWRIWTPVLDRLTEARSVIAPTMPGHRGGPALISGERIDPQADFADEMERQLDAAGVEQTDVVGNSSGGIVALELARRGRARRVVAIGPMGMQTQAQAAALMRYFMRTHGVARPLERFLLLALAQPQLRRAALRDLAAHGERVPTGLARQLVHAFATCEVPALIEAVRNEDGSWPVIEGVEEIESPVLLIWGNRDSFATRDQMERYLEALADVRFVELEDAGHCPQLEQPERVADEILAFTS